MSFEGPDYRCGGEDESVFAAVQEEIPYSELGTEGEDIHEERDIPFSTE